MPNFYVVFVAEGHITLWAEANEFSTAEHYREEFPYHEPELGTGHIIAECPHHGWRPLSQGGICQTCDDFYSEFEFRQEADFYDDGPPEPEELL